MGRFEGWQPPTVGGCTWGKCPRNRYSGCLAQDRAIFFRFGGFAHICAKSYHKCPKTGPYRHTIRRVRSGVWRCPNWAPCAANQSRSVTGAPEGSTSAVWGQLGRSQCGGGGSPEPKTGVMGGPPLGEASPRVAGRGRSRS